MRSEKDEKDEKYIKKYTKKYTKKYIKKYIKKYQKYQKGSKFIDKTWRERFLDT